MRTYNLQKLKRRVAIPEIVRTIDAVVVHHTASPQSTSFKQIYRWHTIENGWSDIGYHFVITEDGTIHEGRNINTSGAHCRGFNANSIGVCVTGNTNHEKPNQSQLESLRELLDSLLEDLDLDKDEVFTHKEKGRTECPGYYLNLWVNQYRNQ